MRVDRKRLASAVMMALVAGTLANTHVEAAEIYNGKILSVVGTDSYNKPDQALAIQSFEAMGGGTINVKQIITPEKNDPEIDNQPAMAKALVVAAQKGTVTAKNADIVMGARQYPALFSLGGTINIGYNEDGTLFKEASTIKGAIVISDKQGRADYSSYGFDKDPSVINVGLSSGSTFSGFAVNNLADKKGEINIAMDGAKWNHTYVGDPKYAATTYNDAKSTVNRLVGTASRDDSTVIRQMSINDIRVKQMSGHMNVIYERGMLEIDPASGFTGGNFRVTSADPGAAVHAYTTQQGLDTTDESAVNHTLDALAHKIYYENAATGESNLSGTVSIASEGLVSSFVRPLEGVTEGAITWQADKGGQGSYVVPVTPEPQPEQPADPTPVVPTPVTPEPQPEQPAEPTPVDPTPVTPEPQPQLPVTPTDSGDRTPVNPPVQRGDYDTPHMRGVRGAIISNVGAWRTMTDDMYRTRVLQQGTEPGIWAQIGAGRYEFSHTGVSTESDYTRFRGGFDKKFGTVIVGGEIDYLRGSDDFTGTGASRAGSGKERAFAGGLYATKDLGNNAYVHVATKAGRVSNDFTVYNEIGSALHGKTSSNAYSISARVGKQVKFDNGLYVEPQAQLSYMRLGGDDFNAGSMHVSQSAVNSTAGKLGVELGKTFGAGSMYTRFGVGHAFTGTVKTTYSSGNAMKSTETDVKGTWTELAFGGRYRIGENNSLFADISTGLSGDYKQKWGVNAGFNHKF